MKVSAVVMAAAAQVASAHYFFDQVVINGATTPGFRYIREFTRPIKYNPIKLSTNPPADLRENSTIDGPDGTCNQGAFTNAGKTQILEVAAGSDLTVRLGVGATMQHPGPSLWYMSRAPNDDVKSYDGLGDWFKISQTGVCNKAGDFTTNAWCTWDKSDLTTTIPKNVPSGEYLVRVEHIGVHGAHVNQPEHYVSCIQVKVTGGGNGTPGPTVKIPGAYKSTDAYANFSIYGGYKDFPFPGPAVWDGAAGSGSGSGSATSPATAAAAATTLVQTTRPAAAATSAVASPPSSGGACAAKYAQCGGTGFTGPTCCTSSTCTVSNSWYSQCL